MNFLKLKDLTIFDKKEPLFEDLSFTFEKNNLYPLFYKIEEYKLSYIFRYLLELRGNYEGRVYTDKGDKNWEDKVGFLPAEGGYYPHLTGIEYLSFFNKYFFDFSLDKARDYIYKFKIPTEVKLGDLSEFQAVLILFCGLLASNKLILFLEKPFSCLPGEETALLQSLLEEEAQQGKLILFTVNRDKIDQYQFKEIYNLSSTEIKRSDLSAKDEKQPKVKKIPVWNQEKAMLIDHQKIKWISTHSGKSTLHTEIGDYEVNLLLQELQSRLDSPPFFRCHRSFIVNIEHVEEVITWFNGSYILKIGDNEIPVSRSRTGELKNLLGI